MADQQSDYLEKTIKKHISLFDGKRQRNKYLSLGIKLTSAFLSAAIIILLGLNVSAEIKTNYANIALVLSAIITILNTWDAFFNHKTLWVRFTVATQSLRSIDEELQFFKSKGNLNDSQIEQLHKKFKDVLTTLDRDWETLRKEEQAQTRLGT
jgi:hypothetical protein